MDLLTLIAYWIVLQTDLMYARVLILIAKVFASVSNYAYRRADRILNQY